MGISSTAREAILRKARDAVRKRSKGAAFRFIREVKEQIRQVETYDRNVSQEDMNKLRALDAFCESICDNPFELNDADGKAMADQLPGFLKKELGWDLQS